MPMQIAGQQHRQRRGQQRLAPTRSPRPHPNSVPARPARLESAAAPPPGRRPASAIQSRSLIPQHHQEDQRTAPPSNVSSASSLKRTCNPTRRLSRNHACRQPPTAPTSRRARTQTHAEYPVSRSETHPQPNRPVFRFTKVALQIDLHRTSNRWKIGVRPSSPNQSKLLSRRIKLSDVPELLVSPLQQFFERHRHHLAKVPAQTPCSPAQTPPPDPSACPPPGSPITSSTHPSIFTSGAVYRSAAAACTFFDGSFHIIDLRIPPARSRNRSHSPASAHGPRPPEPAPRRFRPHP